MECPPATSSINDMYCTVLGDTHGDQLEEDETDWLDEHPARMPEGGEAAAPDPSTWPGLGMGTWEKRFPGTGADHERMRERLIGLLREFGTVL